MKKTSLLFSGWIVLSAALFAVTPLRAENRNTLVDVLTKGRETSSFLDAMKRSGFIETIKGAGPFTVLAPTDAAFKAVDKSALDALLRNKDDLTKIMAYHVVPGRHTAADLRKMDGKLLRTMQGADVSVRIKKGVLMIDHAKSTRPEIAAENGTVIYIDAVLSPQPKM